MKTLRSFILIVGIIMSSLTLKAQTQADLSAFVQASAQDAGKLMGAYTTPAVKAVSYGMTSGWFNTGKTHGKLGFDLGVTFSAVMVPTSDNYFNATAIGLSPETHIVSPVSGMAPTIIGPKDPTSYTSTYKNSLGNTVTVNFQGPEGLDLKKAIGTSAVPVPMIQAGIGLFANTDLKVRILPEQTISNQTKISMLGFGLMHDIKQHIPGLKLVPIDLSVIAAYNMVKGNTNLANTNATSSRPVSPDGKATYDMNSWVAQLILSKKFSVVTLYAAVGYASVSTKFAETGSYTIQSTTGSFTQQVPVNINFTNTGAKLTGGIRFKFGPLYLNADYTLQKYNAVTAGFGLTFR